MKNYGLSILGYSRRGLIPIISTKLPFLDSSISLDTFLYRFATPLGMLLGQGDQYNTGFYGPYPIPNYSEYHAFSFSFFLEDTILGTPRNDLNAFLIAILFVKKTLNLNKSSIEGFFSNYIKTLNNLNDLLSKPRFEVLTDLIGEELFQDEKITVPIHEEIIVNEFNSNSENKDYSGDKVFINLQTEPESIIALPWILHAVYHGLEQATIDILGESSSLLEILMEQYTAEILDRFHLFDSIFEKKNPGIKDALELGIRHLAQVGEYVTVTPLSENKFVFDIKCTFSNAVHPYLPITKCLWMRYLTAMVRKALPDDKEIHLKNSSFDSEFGSKTILEIVPKVFKEV